MKPLAAAPTVLIVDDESKIADTLCLILRQHGFQTSAAYSGEAALAGFPGPEVIVADVAMPGMNGIELAILIRQANPKCRILLMSGAAASEDLLHAAKQDGHHFEIFAKPFHPNELVAWIRADATRAPD